MNTDNAKGQLRPDDFNMFDDANVGDWQFYGDVSILIRIPNGTPRGDIGSLPLKPQNDWQGQPLEWWQWDGNKEAPTLTPSILHGHNDWHGYMVKGELISC